MGLDDRDWYREAQLDRLKKTQYFKKSSEPKNRLLIILFWVGLLFLFLQAYKYAPRFAFASPFTPPLQQVVNAPSPAAVPRSEGRRQQPQTNLIEEVQPERVQEPVDEPKPQGVVTIYRCKAYSGGVFWSSAHCGTQQALIDRMTTVPNGMPFEQQVQIAEGQRVEAMALYNQQPSPAVQRSDRCVALKREREVIESRYTNWQWQPLEVINPDQTRMRGLRAEQARLGCPTQ